MTPTQRTLAKLRADGYLAEVVEHWNPHARIRQDLLGLADILALREGEVLLVQVTSRSNVASRVRKLLDHENLKWVARARVRLHVHGWGKMASGRYELRTVEVV